MSHIVQIAMRVACLVFVILAISVSCGEAAKKRKKFEGDFEFADDAVIRISIALIDSVLHSVQLNSFLIRKSCFGPGLVQKLHSLQ